MHEEQLLICIVVAYEAFFAIFFPVMRFGDSLEECVRGDEFMLISRRWE